MRERKNKDPTLKATHQQWQTMHVCKNWKFSKNATCPLCQQCDESWNHVLQCNNEHIARLRTEHLHKFKKKMNELKTNNLLQQHLLSIIESWTSDEKIEPPSVSWTLLDLECESSFMGPTNIVPRSTYYCKSMVKSDSRNDALVLA